MCVKNICAKELCLTKLCATKLHVREICVKDSVCVCGKIVCNKVLFERDGLTRSVDVTKCQAKETSMSPSATPATQSAAAPRATNCAQARHQGQPSVISATPATQNEGRCHQVPRLPRKVPRRHGRLAAPMLATRANPVS